MANTVTHLECSVCGKRFQPGKIYNLCDCSGPLLVNYDLAKLRQTWTPEAPAKGPNTMWRYAPVLPPVNESTIVSLGEGMTPLVRTERLGKRLGANDLWIKDEGLNPTGSFKARGLSCAVSMARELGIKKLAIPSAGNAASALAAYAAAAGLESFIFMPRDVPQANFVECKAYGARVTLVDGLISDCARLVAAGAAREGWFDVTTLKEPYRIEGKKTMGYELAEQMSWQLPDAIFYPTGGGVGLIGMWKAFGEMEQLGWLTAKKRPKMIVVQAAGCAPAVKAWNEHKPVAEMWQNAHTAAAGLRVPKPYADYIILDIVKQSGGTAVSVSDQEIFAGVEEWASKEGVLAAPEGAACLPAYQRLVREGFLKATDKVVLFNTGSGLKYIDVIAQALKIESAAQPATAAPSV